MDVAARPRDEYLWGKRDGKIEDITKLCRRFGVEDRRSLR